MYKTTEEKNNINNSLIDITKSLLTLLRGIFLSIKSINLQHENENSERDLGHFNQGGFAT